MEVQEDTLYLLAGQKKFKDEYKNPDMLPKIKKSYIAEMIEAIEQYFRSCPVVVRAPLAYAIKKTIQVQNYGDYPKYLTCDNEMINKMLHLPPEKNKFLMEQDAQSIGRR